MPSKLTPQLFPYVYVPDTEYVALPGEQQRPVCLVAHGFNKGRRIEMFFDAPAANPFPDLKNTLFLGYNLPAELKTMLALGWELPEHCVDLYVEFLSLINGKWRGKDCLKDLGTGLVDAVKYFGGNPMDFWKGNKEEERRYILENGLAPPTGTTMEAHQQRILQYCEEDVNATVWLGRQMLPEIDLDQALWRGKYCKPNAYFEHNGVPLDAERFHAIERESSSLKLSIAKKIEETHHYGVYVIEGRDTAKNKPHPVFKMSQFIELLTSKGITVGRKGALWQATPSGDPVLEDDYFGDMCNTYPELQPLRQCRKSINSLGRFETVIGKDGFNRAPLWMFGTVTSRNNPKARAFLLSRPHWVRNLIAPREGMALVACDVTGAEDWLAAGFSGDPNLMRIYSSGADSYMEFAAVTGAVPPGTKRNKSNKELEIIRAQHKTAKLAIQYGVGAETLSTYLGVPVWKAGLIINSHKQGYSVYWQWVEDQAALAKERGYVETDFGWRQSTEHMSANSILNFPQQAGCAELLRCACILLVDAGWGYALAAPHHDALYMHVEATRAEECKQAVEDAFVTAGQIIMGLPDFLLRVHADVVYYPDHYEDADGTEIWQIVSQYFGWDEFEASQKEVIDEQLLAHSS
jgi:DNA polymerase family A